MNAGTCLGRYVSLLLCGLLAGENVGFSCIVYVIISGRIEISLLMLNAIGRHSFTSEFWSTSALYYKSNQCNARPVYFGEVPGILTSISGFGLQPLKSLLSSL